MKIYKPTTLGLFQLLVACVLVAIYTCPGEAMHHGPMIIFKAGKGHGQGNGMGAMGLLAAGLAFKVLTELVKKGHHEHHGSGHHGAAYGHPTPISFASHDAHLPHYGYDPQGYGGQVWV
ncbi:unnamed protein product [Larinioides sclopetarius]|uniref:Uncharacterized protein n=1 Tax=Larinioides sclopetarius TaxID=280406 RepID=A0AAV2A2J5_9ARAC